MVGGWVRDPEIGGSGFEILSALSAFQVWATLVPSGTNGLKLSGGGESVVALTSESGISFGYLVVPVPKMQIRPLGET